MEFRMPEVESELGRRLAQGEEVVLATVIRLDGEPPSRPGAKALVGRRSVHAGTLGCSEFDAAALADGPGLLDGGRPDVRVYRHDLGAIEVFMEPYQARPQLVVISATPVAACLAPWAAEAGFAPVVLETRAERLSDWEVPITVITTTAELGSAPPAELYVVATDHDAPGLVELLSTLIGRQPRYVGVMGSRRHTGHHLEALLAMGLPEQLVSRIQSPVGLDVGARTPGEIAASILAGLVAVRRGRPGGWMDREGSG
jgi:xanthine dehydrogenase accessory factor